MCARKRGSSLSAAPYQVVVTKSDYKVLGAVAAPIDNYFRVTGARPRAAPWPPAESPVSGNQLAPRGLQL
jgi:hypothetical protein